MQVSILTGMGWTEVLDLPWDVIETYIDVLAEKG